MRTLAQGLALAEGRRQVTGEDVAVIRHIAFSSIPGKRRGLLRALAEQGGTLETKAVMEALGVSTPTALDRMKELAATGLVTYTPGEEQSSTATKIELAASWVWLCDDSATVPDTP